MPGELWGRAMGARWLKRPSVGISSKPVVGPRMVTCRSRAFFMTVNTAFDRAKKRIRTFRIVTHNASYGGNGNVSSLQPFGVALQAVH